MKLSYAQTYDFLLVVIVVFVILYPPVGGYYATGRSPVNLQLAVFDEFTDAFKGLGPVLNVGSAGGVHVDYVNPVVQGNRPSYYDSKLGSFLGNSLVTYVLWKNAAMYSRLGEDKRNEDKL